MSHLGLSVVIPTLDEEEHLGLLLACLRAQRGVDAEIIVADGGSTDGTLGIARREGATVVEAGRGRGRQMNAGAARAGHDLLLFLHADSRIDDEDLLGNALEAFESQPSGRTAGHFALRFLSDPLGETGRRSLAYFHYEEKTKLNREDVFGGDQGLLIRRVFFDTIGGFDESLHFLEDKQIGAEILARGRMITLPGRLATSTRRFESEGFGRRMLLAAVIMGLMEIDWQPFFERVKSIYREQASASRLDIAHFFSEIHRLSVREPLGVYCRGWYGIGRYVRRNSWQLFHFADSCLSYVFGGSRRPFLTVYDRVVHPLTDFAPFNALTAAGVWAGFYLTWLYYWLRDRLPGSRPAVSTSEPSNSRTL